MATSLFSAKDTVERKHMFAIDLARGLGALVVLFWHYQHFFYQGTQARMTIPIEAQPLFGIFEPFYRYGHYAVEFFWLISGFVFAATYLGRRPSAADFSIARLARLYPLHFITLVVVALLQIASLSLVGREQIYPFNDPYHFVLNVFFASSWGLEEGYSFNAPIWSVSVEIVVYVAFWMSLRFIFAFGIALPVIVSVVAFVIRSQLPYGDAVKFADCFLHFYIGVVVYLAYLATERRPLVITAVAAVIVLAGAAILYDGRVRIDNGITLLLIGILIGLSALEATTHGQRLEQLRWIGDNTYGTYLWHVPI
jgi:peptidoglycan/LPS O-acetylase OafA/YrhL